MAASATGSSGRAFPLMESSMVSETKSSRGAEPAAGARTVTSRDGTRIACETQGRGPALILVDGALCSRAMGPMPPLGKLLAARFTVWTYDRRGRGASGNTLPYAVEREVEDLGALIAAAGGSAFVYGISSGAALALEAAARGLPIARLALFEAPFIVDDSRAPVPADIVERMEALLAEDRRGDVVRLFMKAVGVPAFFIALMRLMPAWGKLKAVAHTVPYDLTILRGNQSGRPLPAARWSGARMPTLVMDGGKSPAWMRHAQRALAAALPGSQLRTLPGQTHMARPAALEPALREFFGGA
jgi:pimeloyl-ACP methyl ester carboxylesterase